MQTYLYDVIYDSKNFSGNWMFKNKEMVTYIVIYPYSELLCNHVNYVFEED